MSKILIVGEHAEGKLNAGVGKVVAAAQGIGGDIEVVLFGDSLGEIASQAAALDGVAKVYTVERAENAKPMAAMLAPQIVEIAKGGYSHVLFPGGTSARTSRRAFPRCSTCSRCPTSWPCTAQPASIARSTLATPS